MPLPASATAILSIDVGAVVANWRTLNALAPAAAVVKADAYGLGAAPLATALAEAGCTSFFVATPDEALALRATLPQAEIFALCGPLPGCEADFAAHAITPVLNSPEQVERWQNGRPAALHVDTGMARLGLGAEEVAWLTRHPRLLAGVSTCLVMSHLACPDEPDHPKNAAQRSEFTRLAPHLPAARRSLAASSGIFLGPDYRFDLIRPGAALYGLNPTPGQPNPMRQVVRLKGKILQVRDVDSPQTVGYGATHRIVGKGRLAVVAAGYADGLFRSLSNRGTGVLGGMAVPVVGRVSMDLTIFDVSRVPDHLARPGEWIELIGPGHDADLLAEEAGTIGYEVLTALGRRYQRQYESLAS